MQHPPMGFVAHRVMPFVPVKFESDDYYKIYAANRIMKDSVRAPNTESKEVAYGYETASYAAKEFALHADIPGRVLRNSDNPLRPREDAAAIARDMVLLDIERRVAALALASTNPKSSPAAVWDGTLANVLAAQDIWEAKEEVRKKIGRQPNTILMSAAAANALSIWMLEQKNGAGVEFSSVEQYFRSGSLPPAMWGMEVLVGGASYSSELRPADVDLTSLTDVWTDNVLVFWKDRRPGIRTLSFGYTLRVRKSEGVSRGHYTGPRDKDDQWVEYHCIEAHEVVSTDACHMIENVLT